MKTISQSSHLLNIFRAFNCNIYIFIIAKTSGSVSSEPYNDFIAFSTDLALNEPSTNAEEVLPSKATLGASTLLRHCVLEYGLVKEHNYL